MTMTCGATSMICSTYGSPFVPVTGRSLNLSKFT